jgi:hypothetical protein
MAESALHASHACPAISPVETALVPEVAPAANDIVPEVAAAANDRPVNEGSVLRDKVKERPLFSLV